jgi:alpha-glucosidase
MPPSPSTPPFKAAATWVLCDQDVTRTVTGYGRTDTSFDLTAKAFNTPTGLSVGTRRARAAALATLALPAPCTSARARNWAWQRWSCCPEHLQDAMHLALPGH